MQRTAPALLLFDGGLVDALLLGALELLVLRAAGLAPGVVLVGVAVVHVVLVQHTYHVAQPANHVMPAGTHQHTSQTNCEEQSQEPNLLPHMCRGLPYIKILHILRYYIYRDITYIEIRQDEGG